MATRPEDVLARFEREREALARAQDQKVLEIVTKIDAKLASTSGLPLKVCTEADRSVTECVQAIYNDAGWETRISCKDDSEGWPPPVWTLHLMGPK